LHWYEAHGIGKKDLKIKRSRASLILGKVYRILPDSTAAKDDLVRIVDESGEDYLYHKDHFVFVDFPSGVKKKILALQGAARDGNPAVPVIR
jgi:hypothetical protein